MVPGNRVSTAVDKRKLKVLRESGYVFGQTCGLCTFVRPGKDGQWGTCTIHTYEHAKHSGPPREMSVSLFGGCSAFQPKDDIDERLGGFAEFLP